MTLIALSAFQDNYIWIIKNQSHFICIDPGDAVPVIEFAEQEQWTLSHILLTHHHTDHIGGVSQLKQYFPNVVVHNIFELTEKPTSIHIDKYKFNVLITQEHTCAILNLINIGCFVEILYFQPAADVFLMVQWMRYITHFNNLSNYLMTHKFIVRMNTHVKI